MLRRGPGLFVRFSKSQSDDQVLTRNACRYDGLCAYNSTAKSSSGFYVQACTDPSYEDSACPQPCSTFDRYTT